VEHHHDPAATGDAAIIRVADMLAHHSHGQPIDPRQLAAAAGRLGIEAAALRDLTYELTDPGDAAPRAVTPSPLSPQQTAVLRGLAGGHVYKQIAQDLGLSVSTVRSHAHAVYTKLGVNDRAQAVLTAAEKGWL
jgi:DNA-binding NarL/FixJ family response regulator